MTGRPSRWRWVWAAGFGLLLLATLSWFRAQRGERTVSQASEAGSLAGVSEDAPTDSGLAAPEESAGQRSEAELAPETDSSAAPSPRDPSAGRLVVRVFSRNPRAPLAGVRVLVLCDEPELALPAQVDGTHGSLDAAPLTTSEGTVEFELPSGVALRLFAHTSAGDFGGAERRLEPLEAGEPRELVLELASGPDRVVHGRVLDEATSEPLAGARIEIQEEQQRAQESDADGRFVAHVRSWKNPRLEVRLAGYSRGTSPAFVGHDTPAEALEVRLTRGANLTVRVLGGSGEPLLGVRAVLTIG